MDPIYAKKAQMTHQHVDQHDTLNYGKLYDSGEDKYINIYYNFIVFKVVYLMNSPCVNISLLYRKI